MPALKSTRKRESSSQSSTSAAEVDKKDLKSHIPLNQSSKQTFKQSKLPGLISRTKPAASTKKVTPSELVTPINLKFGSKSATAPVAPDKSITPSQTGGKGENPKKVPVVIDIDSDEDEFVSPAPKKVSSNKTINEPEKAVKPKKLQPNIVHAKKEETDWKSKFETADQKLQERERERKELDTKIPNMIEEFQKCLSNKDSLIRVKEQKIEELKKSSEEKNSKIAELTKENKENNKSKNEALKKNEDYKKELSARDKEASVQEKEVKDMKKKLKELENASKKQEDELRRKSEECLEKAKIIKELEDLKPKLKTQVDRISQLEKERNEKEEKMTALDEEIKNRSIREQDYRIKIKKLKEENDRDKEKSKEMNTKISILEADLNLHFNLVDEKEEEIKKVNDHLGKVENEKESLKKQLKMTETELKSAKDGLANFKLIENHVRELMERIGTQHETIGNLKVALESREKQIVEMSKVIKDQNLKVLQEKSSNAKLTSNMNATANIVRKTNDENLSMKQTLHVKEREIQQYKSIQEKLCLQINGLEVSNFTKKETIIKLNSEVTSLKEQNNAMESEIISLKEKSNAMESEVTSLMEQANNSVKFVSLEVATEDYLKILKRRKLNHLTHNSCSQEKQADNDLTIDDPLSFEEEPILVVDSSYEEEEEGIYVGVSTHSVSDVEVTLEDIEEDSSNPPHCNQLKGVSYPDNMLTYLWPLAVATKKEEVRNIKSPVEEHCQPAENVSSNIRQVFSLSATPAVRKFPTTSLQLRPAVKRKSYDTLQRLVKRRRNSERTEEPLAIPSFIVPSISYNWPVVPYQSNRGPRGTKRSLSLQTQLEGSNLPKRIKLDFKASSYHLVEPKTPSSVREIFSELGTNSMSIRQGALESVIDDKSESPNWPVVLYQPSRYLPRLQSDLSQTEPKLDSQAISSRIVDDVLAGLLLLVEDRISVGTDEENDNMEDPNVKIFEVEKISATIVEEVLLSVLTEDSLGSEVVTPQLKIEEKESPETGEIGVLLKGFILELVDKMPEDPEEEDHDDYSRDISTELLDEVVQNIQDSTNSKSSVQLILRALDNLYQ